MSLDDFTDEQLNEIFKRGRSTLERIERKSERLKYRIMDTNDDDFFISIVEVIFFAGMRATVVEAHLDRIWHYFYGYKKVLKYQEEQIKKMLDDKKMIRHEKKIRASVENAKGFNEIVKDWGSFGKYIASFDAWSERAKVEALRDDLTSRFSRFQRVSADHFLNIQGFPIVKPDIHMRQIFHRIGLTEDENDDEEVIDVAWRMAEAAGVPVNQVDRLCMLGMKNYYYDKSEVCGSVPDCDRTVNPCELKDMCKYYRESHL